MESLHRFLPKKTVKEWEEKNKKYETEFGKTTTRGGVRGRKESLTTKQGEHNYHLSFFSSKKSPQLLGKSVVIECAVVSWTSAASAEIFRACRQWGISALLTQPLAPRRRVARWHQGGQLSSARRPRSSTAPSIPGGSTVVVLFWIRRSFE